MRAPWQRRFGAIAQAQPDPEDPAWRLHRDPRDAFAIVIGPEEFRRGRAEAALRQ